MNDFDDLESARRRRQLIRRLRKQGIRADDVLQAIQIVPRQRFVSSGLREVAHENIPLPIGHEQTISQPYIVALMAESLELRPQDRVLEIGTGSGYSAAVLSRLAREVYTVERHEDLAISAQSRLRELGCDNVHVLRGDGTQGWKEHAPYDAIVVTAGGPRVPPSLVEQLAIGGRLVIPVGTERGSQVLLQVRKTGADRFEQKSLGDVRFVPLVGAAGWESEEGKEPPRDESPEH